METNFWSKVKKTRGCWIWTAGIWRGGYGQARLNGKSMGAHRAAWTLAFGPIPAGKLVLHRCDNRLCVNPAHLFLGTHKENQEDMTAKGRGRIGRRNGRARLTTDQVGAMRQMYRWTSVTQAALAKRFGVSESCVCHIISGRSRAAA